jgi:signal peptidase I
MFNKWEKYSYADQRSRIARLRGVAFRIILAITGYILLTNIFFPMILVETNSMQPTINPGDRFIFSAFNMRRVIPAFGKDKDPYARGSIVLLDPTEKKGRTFFMNVMDRLFRFFTAGKLGFSAKKEQLYVKRIIGIPGDEIVMENYIVQVHPADSSYTFTEYEVTGKHYEPDIPQVSALWDESIPFSGSMAKITLGADECFVLSDDRSNTNDSRTWGPVSLSKINGTAIFRYWPPSRINIP